MAHRTLGPQAARSDTGPLTLTEDLVRERAYQLYEERGRQDGYDLDDWFRAEAEMSGKKSSDSATVHETAAMSTAAA
jgi:hypothetical protein